MTARCLAVWGTASDAGKSTLVTALARLLVRRGHSVSPFKAQNMARNAYVCSDGGEIGVAQAVQARAARVEPCVDHNPILLKPEPGLVSQVIVHGVARGKLAFGQYRARGREMQEAVEASLARLRARHDVVLLEGAGSPAEINLQDHDLANLHAARVAEADVLLVADIDRGGAFASVVGTLALVPDDLRPRVRGVIFNRFRGDVSLLEPGLRLLEGRTGVPVLGVVGHLGELRLPDEDSVGLERFRRAPRAGLEAIEVAVVDTPCLANFEDVLPFAGDAGVRLRLTAEPRDLLEADLVVLAGSKNTAHDLAFVRARGLDRALAARTRGGRFVLGICGGTQMLGRALYDPHGVESHASTIPGMGLLPIETRFAVDKRTVPRRGVLDFARATHVEGFHLHHGRIEVDPGVSPVVWCDDGERDGARAGAVLGTMLHRIADSADARAALYALAGCAERAVAEPIAAADPYDALADAVGDALDLAAIERLVERRSRAPASDASK